MENLTSSSTNIIVDAMCRFAANEVRSGCIYVSLTRDRYSSMPFTTPVAPGKCGSLPEVWHPVILCVGRYIHGKEDAVLH